MQHCLPPQLSRTNIQEYKKVLEDFRKAQTQKILDNPDPRN